MSSTWTWRLRAWVLSSSHWHISWDLELVVTRYVWFSVFLPTTEFQCISQHRMWRLLIANDLLQDDVECTLSLLNHFHLPKANMGWLTSEHTLWRVEGKHDNNWAVPLELFWILILYCFSGHMPIIGMDFCGGSNIHIFSLEVWCMWYLSVTVVNAFNCQLSSITVKKSQSNRTTIMDEKIDGGMLKI